MSGTGLILSLKLVIVVRFKSSLSVDKFDVNVDPPLNLIDISFQPTDCDQIVFSALCYP